MFWLGFLNGALAATGLIAIVLVILVLPDLER